jgi:hypothetical protein
MVFVMNEETSAKAEESLPIHRRAQWALAERKNRLTSRTKVVGPMTFMAHGVRGTANGSRLGVA